MLCQLIKHVHTCEQKGHISTTHLIQVGSRNTKKAMGPKKQFVRGGCLDEDNPRHVKKILHETEGHDPGKVTVPNVDKK